MFEVWEFIREYRDFLHVPTDQPLTLNSFSFLNQMAPEQLAVDRSQDYAATSRSLYLNAYHILTKFLLSEETKRLTTLRKFMRDPSWLYNMYNVLYYTAFCDDCNFQSFIRGYFDSMVFKTSK